MLPLTIRVGSGTLHVRIALEVGQLCVLKTSSREGVLESLDKGGGVAAVNVVEYEEGMAAYAQGRAPYGGGWRLSLTYNKTSLCKQRGLSPRVRQGSRHLRRAKRRTCQ